MTNITILQTSNEGYQEPEWMRFAQNSVKRYAINKGYEYVHHTTKTVPCKIMSWNKMFALQDWLNTNEPKNPEDGVLLLDLDIEIKNFDMDMIAWMGYFQDPIFVHGWLLKYEDSEDGLWGRKIRDTNERGTGIIPTTALFMHHGRARTIINEVVNQFRQKAVQREDGKFEMPEDCPTEEHVLFNVCHEMNVVPTQDVHLSTCLGIRIHLINVPPFFYHYGTLLKKNKELVQLMRDVFFITLIQKGTADYDEILEKMPPVASAS